MSADILAAARGWIGTPYRHQGRRKGVGCDCLGLVLGVWTEVYGQPPEEPPPYSADWGEPQGAEVLLRAAGRYLRPLPREVEAGPGTLIVFRMRDTGVAKHLGLLGKTGAASSFVHSMSGHGVVEAALTSPWARRIAGRFAFPDQGA